MRGATGSRSARALGSPGSTAPTSPASFAARVRKTCATALRFTGYTVDGGYAQYALAPEEFVYPIPESFAARQAAPLLCAGIIGFRALRLSGIKPDGNLAFYGFGAAAHVAIQVARHWGVQVYACTRGAKHQQLAIELGAVWAGEAAAEPPREARCGDHLRACRRACPSGAQGA